uniref:HAT C-terminal dimerisation domain-containing protein n=1 Tax=Amphimedon queenslandica TaxID=400682 RepID=A0A1X7UN42_AMPQE
MEKQKELHRDKQPLDLQRLSDTRWTCRFSSVNALCRTFDSILDTVLQVAESTSEFVTATKSLLTEYRTTLTIAVTSAESEQSFSTMKRIKTRLRTTMVEERLSDLSILSIEKEVAQSIEDKIIDEFASSDKNSRILLNSYKFPPRGVANLFIN